MIYINNLTNNAFQQFSLNAIPGVQINCLLRYMPRIQRWIMNITYNSVIINGITVEASPNILRQWKNLIPFGIACTRDDGLDPYDIDDFSNKLANLYLLTADEVAAMETEIYT